MARIPYRAIAIVSLGLLSGLAYAQDSEPYEADPPDRAARLSFIQGEVSLQPAGEEEWAPALVNRPLTTGDKLWTEPGSRAEIYVGPAAVRLDGATGFSFLNVDDDTIQMRVTAGVLNVSVRTLDGGEHIEIDTPNIALSLLRAGHYRVEVNDAGDTTVVKVSEGSAQATGSSRDTVIYAQQVVTFTGTDDLVARFGTLGAPDDFDSWSLERDRRDEKAASSRTAEYVSPEVTGYQDLDDHGTWSSEPEYGYVWTPNYVAVDWAPYRYGRWVSIAPWGWTWIDDARWGYAPFHYGRWAHVRNRWCWVPGPRHLRPVYSPAFVGWVGSPGAHVSWFPLGPRDVYMPGRHHSRHYVERVNFSNAVANRLVVANAYDNRGAHGTFQNRVASAVTAAARNQFTSAGRIGEQRIRVSEQDLARSAVGSAPRMTPSLESRLGGAIRSSARVPPRTVADRQVVVRRDPPPAAARFARRPIESQEVSRIPEALTRTDRPSRSARSSFEPEPRPQISVFDRNALAARVREDGERQVREQQQREVDRQRHDTERLQREGEQHQQRDLSLSQRAQRWQRQGDEQRQRNEQHRQQDQRQQHEQRQQREQYQDRGSAQRMQDAVRQAAGRQAEQRQQPARQPDVGRSQPPPQPQRQQHERHERQDRSETPRPARSENHSRPNRQ